MKHLLVIILLVAVVQGSTLPRSSGYPAEEYGPNTAVDFDNGLGDKAGNRIVSGIVATRGQFPHQVALYYGSLFCGGSLISQRWVLTCANCAQGSTSVTVHLGAQNLDNINTEPGRFIISSTGILIHYAYGTPNAANNIALINLGFDIPLSNYIKPIGLASGINLFVDNPARVSGWGRDRSSGSISSELKYTDLTVMSNELCTQTFVSVYDSQVCAKGPSSGGICNEDSGGALVDLVNGKQVGIATTWAAAGCETDKPSIYTRVSSYATWITANTGIIL